jgi:predicted GNAT superfamily acetyltransferase
MRKTRRPPQAAAAAREIVVRHCRGLDELAACIETERAVWGAADIDLVPLPLFVVAAHTGGEVLGAFDGDNMVGFTLALASLRNGRPLLHSHMTAVRESYRDRGIGRRLKLFQRVDALSRGIDRVEWTFDPLEVKNAYFNFRLGAIARRYLPNLYGITTSPLHAGLPTDRLVTEWRLRAARVRRSVAANSLVRKAAPARGKKLARIRIPVELADLRGRRADEAASLQAEIRIEFEHWLKRGYAATGIEVKHEVAEYVLEPWPDQDD